MKLHELCTIFLPSEYQAGINIVVVWFRYYDYQRDISELSTVQHIEGVDITKTLIIPKEQWQQLVRVMSKPPGFSVTKTVRERYEKSVKHAIHG